jgi:hypothetical protein
MKKPAPWWVDPVSVALGTGVLAFMGAYSSFGLRDEAQSLTKDYFGKSGEAVFALFFYVLAAALFLLSCWLAWRKRSWRIFWIAFLGVAVGGAMAGVVEKEPGNYYATSVGIFAAFLLALALAPVESKKSNPRWSPRRRPSPTRAPTAPVGLPGRKLRSNHVPHHETAILDTRS